MRCKTIATSLSNTWVYPTLNYKVLVQRGRIDTGDAEAALEMAAYRTRMTRAVHQLGVPKRDTSRLLRDNPLRIKGLALLEASLPATPRHTMFPLWLLPSGSDQVHG